MNSRLLAIACISLAPVIVFAPLQALALEDGPTPNTETPNAKAPDSGSLNTPGGTNPFPDPEQAKLYATVLQKLQNMNRVKSARHDNDAKTDDDWFVVGGSLTDRQTGYVKANFASFQGVENVARRIVEFENSPHGNNIARWRVFERVGNQSLADYKTEKRLEKFQKYLIAQQRKRQRSSGGGGC